MPDTFILKNGAILGAPYRTLSAVGWALQAVYFKGRPTLPNERNNLAQNNPKGYYAINFTFPT